MERNKDGQGSQFPEHFSVTLNATLHKKLLRYCQENGHSKAEVIRFALTQYLNKFDKGEKSDLQNV
jgi:metal-responsive CopG/Arc/MetJ family transcriptional regulator